MSKLPKYLFALLLSASFLIASAQEKPFKTGLALSGGGAKGLAHIGLLQLIDSLEIQIDYITGTSMGSIIGGMYAIGYSADSIDKVMNEIEWNYVLSNKLPLNRVHINEKESFYNQLFSLPVVKHLPRVPGFLVEGQYLSEMMGKYFFSARNENDFHKLPIPFEAVAADLIAGEKVVLKEGYLPNAIRASMAIPAVFAPIVMDEKLLVDGGLRRNFPVEEIKEMGADFVIGSYTGFRKLGEDEMDNAISSLYQSFAIEAVSDAKEMMKQTDILLDFSESLKDFGTQSFGEYKTIIQAGKREASKLLPQLIELKNRQLEAGIQFNRNEIAHKLIPIQHIQTHAIDGKKITEKERKSILATLDTLHINRLDDNETINSKVEELFSQLNYSKIYYAFSSNENDTKDLNVYFKKSQPNLQLSLHYDTYEDAGIVLRYNHYNLGLDNSKFSAALDLSKYYKSNIYYLKYLNNKRNSWTKLEHNFRREKSNDMIFRAISQVLYFTDPNIQNLHHTGTISFGFSPNISSALTAGFEFKHDRFIKEAGGFARSASQLSDSTRVKPIYTSSHNALFVKFNQNSLDKNLFATSGNKLEAGAKLYFNNKFHLNKPQSDDNAGMALYEIVNPLNYKDSTATIFPTLQIWANEQSVIPLSRKLSLNLQAFAGLNIGFKNNGMKLLTSEEYVVQNQKFTFGGYNNYRFENQFPFPGLTVNEMRFNSLAALTVALQWNVWKSLYVSPRVGAALTLGDLLSNIKERQYFHQEGIGIDLDYLSIIGPIKFSVSISELKSNFFFSLGYQF